MRNATRSARSIDPQTQGVLLRHQRLEPDFQRRDLPGKLWLLAGATQLPPQCH